MRKVLFIIISITICSIHLQSQERYQFVNADFSNGAIIVNEESTLDLGEIGPRHINLVTEGIVSEGATEFKFLENSSNAHFRIDYKINHLKYSYEFQNGVISKLLAEAASSIYTEGFSDAMSTIISISEGMVSITYGGVLLDQSVMLSSTLTISSTLVLLGDEGFKGEFLLSDQSIPSMIEINFERLELWVQEGDVLDVNLTMSQRRAEAPIMEATIIAIASVDPHFPNYQEQIVTLDTDQDKATYLTLYPEILQKTGTYLFEIEEVEGSFVRKGQHTQVVVHVTPKITKENTSKIIFIGYDDDVGGGRDKLVLSNLTVIHPGDCFHITAGYYDRILDLWYGYDHPLVNSQQFCYQGDTSIPPQQVLCINNDPGQLSTEVFIDNKIVPFGISPSVVDGLFDININGGTPITLFTTEGEWTDENTNSILLGTIMSGIVINGFWDDEVNAGISHIPDDIVCEQVQGPVTGTSSWGYYKNGSKGCGTPFDIETEVELILDISETTHWATGIGTGSDDLPEGICSNDCVVCCEEVFISGDCENVSVRINCQGYNTQWYYKNGTDWSSIGIENQTSISYSDIPILDKHINIQLKVDYWNSSISDCTVKSTDVFNQDVNMSLSEEDCLLSVIIESSNNCSPINYEWYRYNELGEAELLSIDDDVYNVELDGNYFVKIVFQNGYYSNSNPIEIVGCTMCEMTALILGPNEYCVGEGIPISLTAQATSRWGNSNLNYNWSTGETTATISLEPNNSTTYHLTVTDQYGCSISEMHEVIVNFPIQDVGMLTGDEERCFRYVPDIIEGDLSVGGEGGDVIYMWQEQQEDGLWENIPNADLPDYQPSEISKTTLYSRFSKRSRCGDWIASNTITKTVNYFEDHPVVFVKEWNKEEGDFSSLESTGCEGDSIHIRVEVSDVVEIKWYNPSGTIISVTDSVLLILESEANAGLYQLELIDQSGCDSSIYYRINYLDQPDIGIVGRDYCSDDTEELSILINGGTGLFEYLWNDNSANNTLIINEQLLTNESELFNYNVLVMDINGCFDTDSITIMVHPNPLVEIQGDISYCVNEMATMSAVITEGNMPYEYKWSTGATTQNIDITNNIGGTYDYQVTVTDANGCTAIAEIQVTQFERPQLVLTASAEKICHKGTATISTAITGGTGAYSYLWSTGSTATSITITGENTTGIDRPEAYVLTVTDVEGCANVDTIEVIHLGRPQIVMTTSAEKICHEGTATINTEVSGGTGAYSYLWSTGAAGSSITITGDNTTGIDRVDEYILTVTDIEGCMNVDTIEVIHLGRPQIVMTTSAEKICHEGSATISTAITGGTGAYSYLWSTEAVGSSITITGNNTTGVDRTEAYVVTVTDAEGCANVDTIEVIHLGRPQIVLKTSAEKICHEGSATISTAVSGGTAAYSYLWSTGSTATSITITGENTTGIDRPEAYVLTVTDVEGCANVDTIEVIHLGRPQIVITTSAEKICHEGTATISTEITGGTGAYSYLWSTGEVGSSITITGENTTGVGRTEAYVVTVTDAEGCSNMDTIEVVHLGRPQIVMTTNAEEVCHEGSATISTEVSGGTGAYSYLWPTGAIGSSITITGNNTTGVDRTDEYIVTVTDIEGCMNVDTIEVIHLGRPQIVMTTSAEKICHEGSATISTAITGGTGAYSYLWSTEAVGSSITITGNNTTGVDRTEAYVVTVTDAEGCANVDTIEVIHLGRPQIVLKTSAEKICHEGSATISTAVSGGTAAYSYLWSTGSTATSITITGENTTGIDRPEAYVLTVTDVEGCANVDTIEVIHLGRPQIVITTSAEKICHEGTATISTEITGGTGAYSYLWSTGEVGSSITITGENTTGVGRTEAYVVTVTDAEGCSNMDTIEVVHLGRPQIVMTTNAEEVCHEGSATISTEVSGGTGAYSYLWPTGAIGSSITITGNNTTGVDRTDEYIVTVTDIEGCMNVDTIEVIHLGRPQIVMTTSAEKICHEGTATISTEITGGTGAYSYLWSTGEVGSSITITGDNTTGVDRTDEYIVTVTDIEGCMNVDTIEVIHLGRPQIVMTTSAEKICHEGTATISTEVSGGTGAYSYLWSTGEVGSSITITGDNTTGVDRTDEYIVTVTDIEGCMNVDTIEVIHLGRPQIVMTTSAEKICHEGTATISTDVSGGTGAYSYLWSTGAVGSSITITGENTTGVDRADEYIVTVTDIEGCMNVDTIEVIHLGRPQIVMTTSAEKICHEGSATLSTTVSGRTGAYSYLWSTGEVESSITITGNNTTGVDRTNEYIVTVTDIEGCMNVDTIEVIHLGRHQIVMTTSVEKICHEGTATISTEITGGTGAHSYLWSTGAVGSSITITGDNTTGVDRPDEYIVTVTDIEGCMNVDTIEVTHLGRPQIVMTTNAEEVCHEGSATLSTTVSGGTGAYSYLWSTGEVGSSITITGDNTTGVDRTDEYIVTVTDIEGCMNVDTIEVIHLGRPQIVMTTSAEKICHEGSATISTEVSGGTGAYSYLWSTGGVASSITITGENTTGVDRANEYIVTVTDIEGCMNVDTIEVIHLGRPQVSLSPSASEVCHGGTSTLTTSVTGGSGSNSYLWSTGSTASSIPITGSNTTGTNRTDNYRVTVTDSKGCVGVNDIDVIHLGRPQVSLSPSASEVCHGGTFDLTTSMTGGSGGYNYLWSTGSTASRITITGSNTTGTNRTDNYEVTVTDSKGCVGVKVINVIHLGRPQVSLSPSAIEVCHGGTSKLTTNVTGGSGGYSYSWSTGSTGSSYTITGSNTTGTNRTDNYKVTVTDSKGCVGVKNINVIHLGRPQVSLSPSAIEVCHGGTFDLTTSVTGGSGGYNYLWPNESTASNITITGSNTTGTNRTDNYKVTVTDSKGCVGVKNINVSHLGQPQVSLSPSAREVCHGGISTLTTSVTGGSGGYNYLWSNESTASRITITGSNTTGTNRTDNYEVTVTDSKGCVGVKNINVIHLGRPQVSLSPSAIEVCHGGTFDLTTSVTGGSGGYNYLWPNESTASNITITGSNTTGTNRTDNYKVTVTDSKGCVGVKNINVSHLGRPQVSLSPSASEVCHGGTFDLTTSMTGGSGGYNYLWSTGSTASRITITGSNTTGTNRTDNYKVTVTDSKGCVGVNDINVSHLGQPQVSLSPSAREVCHGGTFDLTTSVTGGSGGYSYLWPNESTASNITITGSNTTGTNRTDNYEVTVTDSKGCVGVNNNNVIHLGRPQVSLTPSADEVCHGGTFDLTTSVTGGSGGYSYLWPNESTASNITITGSNTTGTNRTDNYKVTVTDSKGCVGVDDIDVNHLASPIVTTVDVIDGICGGPGMLKIFYANNPDRTNVQFSINGGSNYDYTVSVNGGLLTIPNLVANTYHIKSRWSNGACETDHGSYTVKTSFFPETLTCGIGVNGGGVQVSNTCSTSVCAGTDLVIAGGGSNNLSWQWYRANGTAIGPTSSLLLLSNVQVADGGEYYAVATHSNTCKKTLSFSLVVFDMPSVSVSGNDYCEGGFSDLVSTVTGGTSPYSYLWSTGEATSSIRSQEVSPDASNLSLEYIVDIVDDNGCSNSDVEVLMVYSQPHVSVTRINGLCGENGGLRFNISNSSNHSSVQFSLDNGQSFPYSYDDNVGNVQIETSPGTYRVLARWEDQSCPISLGTHVITTSTCLPECTAFLNIGSYKPPGAYLKTYYLEVLGDNCNRISYTFSLMNQYGEIEVVNTSNNSINLGSLPRRPFDQSYIFSLSMDGCCTCPSIYTEYLPGQNDPPSFYIDVPGGNIDFCFSSNYPGQSAILDFSEEYVKSWVVGCNDVRGIWKGPNGFETTDLNLFIHSPGLYTLVATCQTGCETFEVIERDIYINDICAPGEGTRCDCAYIFTGDGCELSWSNCGGYDIELYDPSGNQRSADASFTADLLGEWKVIWKKIGCTSIEKKYYVTHCDGVNHPPESVCNAYGKPSGGNEGANDTYPGQPSGTTINVTFDPVGVPDAIQVKVGSSIVVESGPVSRSSYYSDCASIFGPGFSDSFTILPAQDNMPITVKVFPDTCDIGSTAWHYKISCSNNIISDEILSTKSSISTTPIELNYNRTEQVIRLNRKFKNPTSIYAHKIDDYKENKLLKLINQQDINTKFFETGEYIIVVIDDNEEYIYRVKID